ncbi:MAG: M14 family zinc carboxypeptidase [Marinirhabdus sp.]
MNPVNWYTRYTEGRLFGRYVTLRHIEPLLKKYTLQFGLSEIGTSGFNKPIYCIKMGSGGKKVLAWSQMYGNESTTTKAIFDFLKFMSATKESCAGTISFLKTHTLYIIPMLNPDGAAVYTRENGNRVDLNRDAKNLSQAESRALRDVFEKTGPDLCLNLHGQRTLYSLPGGKPATVSFLAPAVGTDGSAPPARRAAMHHIERINAVLQTVIPSQVGRYDGAFDPNCVGDQFQMAGVPTLLFEAGHYQNDYAREKTRGFVFLALCALFQLGDIPVINSKLISYGKIPKNGKRFFDVVLKNCSSRDREGLFSIGIRYDEVLLGGKINFIPKIAAIGNTRDYLGHKTHDCKGQEILMNIHKKTIEDKNIAKIFYKNTVNTVNLI